MLSCIVLISLGIAVGMIGSVLGIGGGFILLPVLLMIYPHSNPEALTSISLAVVLVNSLSGTFSYYRMKRIDYKSGLIFSVAAIPSAIFGAYSTAFITKALFCVIFGVVMIGASVFIFIKGNKKQAPVLTSESCTLRTIQESDGSIHKYSYDIRIGVILSIASGYLSGLLGIGGGILQVPLLIYILNFPPFIATATSQFILIFSSTASILVHVKSGVVSNNLNQIIFLVLGVLVGSPIGARMTRLFSGSLVTRIFAVTIGIVGIKTLISSL